MSTPACANWRLWIGEEIEGTADVNVTTLFVRDAHLKQVLDEVSNRDIKRVWFCKEFVPHPKFNYLARQLMKQGITVAVEVTMLNERHINSSVWNKAQIYFKINPRHKLKDTDHICVGPPFKDRIFKIADGQLMQPDEYNKDIQLL